MSHLCHLRFDRTFEEAALHSPLKDGALDTHRLEVRRDPLTGARSIHSPRLEAKMFIGPHDAALAERYAARTAERCFLCGDRWQQATPTYPPDILPEGRMRVGEALLFPNLFPIDAVHAVVRVTARHHLRLDELGAPLLRDALAAACAFIRRLGEMRRVRYVTVDGNYLFPAGASIAHPHIQVLGGGTPCTWLDRALTLGRAWAREHGACYWTDLLAEEERRGERFIGATGPVRWVTAFSPQGTNEVIGLLPDRRGLDELDDADVAGLATGLARVLATYHELGLATFNFALFSGPLGERDDAFRCQLRVISRQTVHENYRTDDYFLQRLLGDELILTTPEALAAKVRAKL
jgi:UDPglucose--hexose-1-phosphate uridylyltransferase